MSLMDTHTPNLVAFQSLAHRAIASAQNVLSTAVSPFRRVMAYYGKCRIRAQMLGIGFWKFRDTGLTSADLHHVNNLPTDVLADLIKERRREDQAERRAVRILRRAHRRQHSR